ncbi:hypothetical protein [Donghicola mangrovi]|uniref:Uncharacterized protein n=1 Tax=Donghicola mangrovi TaxID=2729614 RepID=A0A850QIY8_9RHOB|nr:hypothetical protein [Donghicola mangrovi]NVO25761.1 hypothetical protein [Donghicola mangrovi]
MTNSTREKLLWFQAGNFLVSLAVLASRPLGIQGSALIYALIGIKVIFLIYFNDYPAKKDVFSIAFFGLASIEVVLLFLCGSFSMYTFLLGSL